MAGLHLYFYYGKNIPKLIKEGQKASNILNTYVHYFSISVFSNYDHDSYDTDGRKVMRMGLGGLRKVDQKYRWPPHLFTTGGGGEHNEGKRTPGQEGPMFNSCGVLSHSMENIAKGTTDPHIEWFH